MFDKLIVSDAEGADFKNRRNYFMVSSLVVGVLFLAAVVFSIFASDYGLGNREFELVELLPPIDMAAAEPEPRPQTPTTPSRSTSQLPTRQVNMQDVSESPIVPDTVSVVKNNQAARPNSSFIISNTDSNPASNGSGRNNEPSGPGGPGLAETPQVADNTPTVDPPPVKAPPVVKPPPTQSLGVINGRAASLPKPTYPAAAIAVNAQGAVEVQVLIDESGKVISARAINGNPLLRPAAEVAARNARFTPTLLSKLPVKVTGVIIYNFIR
jgi:TonB family protein